MEVSMSFPAVPSVLGKMCPLPCVFFHKKFLNNRRELDFYPKKDFFPLTNFSSTGFWLF